MDTWSDFPLPDGSYSDGTKPWTQQDIFGYLPTRAELSGTRSAIKYAMVPGLALFGIAGNGPHRGSRDVEGKFFVLSGTTLYQISLLGVATVIGTIPGTSRVSMTHNQIAGGNQLLIGTSSNSYLYSTVTGTLATLNIPLFSVDFLNQRFLGVDVQRRFWRYSNLADGSAGAWNTLNNESAESSPDRIVGGVVSQGEWLVFGERTIEVWVNNPSGNADFIRSQVIEKGCANANTLCRLDNTVYFLGNDLIAYRLMGYNPVPVSTKAQAAAFGLSNPAKAFAFTYEDNGYVVYYLTFQDGHTWGFDVTNQRCHRRESYGLTRWRLNTLTKSNGAWYGGDYANGRIYRLQWGLAAEGGAVLPRRIASGVLHANGNRLIVNGLRVTMQTGNAAAPLALAGHLPTAADGASVNYTYFVNGGVPPYTAALHAGELPHNLAISDVDLQSGILRLQGTISIFEHFYTWTLRVTDSTGRYVDLSDSGQF